MRIASWQAATEAEIEMGLSLITNVFEILDNLFQINVVWSNSPRPTFNWFWTNNLDGKIQKYARLDPHPTIKVRTCISHTIEIPIAGLIDGLRINTSSSL